MLILYTMLIPTHHEAATEVLIPGHLALQSLRRLYEDCGEVVVLSLALVRLLFMHARAGACTAANVIGSCDKSSNS